MAKSPFIIAPDEQVIDTWTILYIPPGGGKYNGKLTVTNKRLLYDAKYDVSAKGLLSEALFIKWGSEGYLEINKSEIKDLQTEKSFLSKSNTYTNGWFKHTFNYGALNIGLVGHQCQVVGSGEWLVGKTVSAKDTRY
jgi:hypothetical protein